MKMKRETTKRKCRDENRRSSVKHVVMLQTSNWIAKTNRVDVSGHWTIVVSVDRNVVGAGHPLQSRLHYKQLSKLRTVHPDDFKAASLV